MMMGMAEYGSAYPSGFDQSVAGWLSLYMPRELPQHADNKQLTIVSIIHGRDVRSTLPKQCGTF